MEQARQQQINVVIDEKEAEGIYTNLAMIVHSPTEMVFDFARLMPRAPKTRVLARIIMTPMHAKLFQKTLAENIAKFEKQFGEIKVHGTPNQPSKNIGFDSDANRTDQK